MPNSRIGKLQPWYHQPRPRCMAETKWSQEQCIFSARYVASDGREIYLCKTHADMVDFPVKLIRPSRLQIRR